MANDPGPSIQLQVSPVGLASQSIASSGSETYAQEAIAQPAHHYDPADLPGLCPTCLLLVK